MDVRYIYTILQQSIIFVSKKIIYIHIKLFNYIYWSIKFDFLLFYPSPYVIFFSHHSLQNDNMLCFITFIFLYSNVSILCQRFDRRAPHTTCRTFASFT
jgi:hypothetical protein